MNESITFRLMTVADIDQILVIEHLSFTVPWSREAFHNELLSNPYASYIVMQDHDQVIGYCGLWVVLEEAHVTNIAVLPEYRGRKLGEALLKQAVELVMALGAERLSLEVRVTNHVAQSLYRKLGFQDGGIRKNYYTDNGEDALVMWVNIYETANHIRN
ncbi:ribosomal-protein-alanine N-acetyltransferase [Bacillus mesophilus]|uniref:Ribosomal protein S18-alanine N-acetyltransferase n=1 Tax=Bacillus mesophilus TaxID=1808955 RepID=A0A6M0QCU6_9BACI|nr:ribosomal-protein-alanine N-acetyltransferase [Bacillus mesophilus]NEY74095.1 ribosomal protein S18-alanine N-acetyltransferase [Bacillus mesophilus]